MLVSDPKTEILNEEKNPSNFVMYFYFIEKYSTIKNKRMQKGKKGRKKRESKSVHK